MTDVSEELLVGEDVDSRLVVKQDQILIDHVFLDDDNGIMVQIEGKIDVIVIIVIVIIFFVIFTFLDSALE